MPLVLAHGALPSNDFPTAAAVTMRTLSVTMVGSKITASVDGKVVAAVTDTTHLHGMAAVGSGWHLAYFDDFSLAEAK